MGPEHLLRPWILKAVIEATSAVTQSRPAEYYLGITSRRHERGGVLSESSGQTFFSDGEVTIVADFSEANALVSCSLPNSYDPNNSHCPPAYAIVRLISFRTEFSALATPLTINGQQVHYTVMFKVDEFCILQPNWNMPRNKMPLCSYSPGVQQKAAVFLPVKDAAVIAKRSLAAQVASPSGSSVTSSIIRAVATTMTTTNSRDDSSVLTQFPPSHLLDSIVSQALVCEVASDEYYSRRRKARPVSRVDADCQTSDLEEVVEPVVLVESSLDSQLIQMDSQDSSAPPVATSKTADFLKPNYPTEIPSSAPQPEIPPLMVDPAKKSLLSSSFSKPKSPMFVLSLNHRARSVCTSSNYSPKPMPRTPRREESILDSTRRSLVSSFSAGRKGKQVVPSKPKLLEDQFKPCIVIIGPKCDDMLTDDILARAGLIPSFSPSPSRTSEYFPQISTSAKRVRKSSNAKSVESTCENEEEGETTKLRRKIARKRPIERTIQKVLTVTEESQLVFQEVAVNSVVIVEPMSTASQLGLVEPSLENEVEIEIYAENDQMQVTAEREKGAAGKGLEWWDRLGELAESMFHAFWSVFGKTNNEQH